MPERAKLPRIRLADGTKFPENPPSMAEEEQEKFPLNENDTEVGKETINLKTQTDTMALEQKGSCASRVFIPYNVQSQISS